MLHVLRGVLNTFDADRDIGFVPGMLRGIARVVPALVGDRYRGRLFWLAVAFLRSGHLLFYAEAVRLLQVAIEVMDERGAFEIYGITDIVNEERIPLKFVCAPFDQLGDAALCSTLASGLSTIILKNVGPPGESCNAEGVLLDLLRIALQSCGIAPELEVAFAAEALPSFLALWVFPGSHAEVRSIMEDAGFRWTEVFRSSEEIPGIGGVQRNHRSTETGMKLEPGFSIKSTAMQTTGSPSVEDVLRWLRSIKADT